MVVREFKSAERFSNRAELYAKFRPGYPKEIISFFKETLNLHAGNAVADLGSGTGLFSKLFLDNQNIVYAIEPNREMRETAEKALIKYPLFHSVNGTAENTTLADHSIDYVTAAQAFHWFNREKARQEFKRILKTNGYVVLIWNDRNKSQGLMGDYEQLLLKYASDYKEVSHENISENEIIHFYSTESYGKKTFFNPQFLDYEGLKGRLMSSSFMPIELDASPDLNKELKEIFEKYERKGKIKFEYTTRLYFGKITN